MFTITLIILVIFSLWSLIGFESESRAQPLVAAFSFHLAGREIFLPEAFVPTDYACCHIP